MRVVRFNRERLNVWMYKFLLGTLPAEDVSVLREELKRRYKENQTHSALETKLVDALINTATDKKARKRLAELLDDWEKRNWGD